MGMFDEADDVPQVSMTEYSPLQANTEFPAVNMMQIFDDVTGEEFSFVKGRDGSRYMQLKEEIAQKQKEKQNINVSLFDPYKTQDSEAARIDREIGDLQTELGKAEGANAHNEKHGLKAGEIRVGTRNRSGRVAIDLPEVNDLQALMLREASAVIDVTRRLKNLTETINIAEQSDPMVVSQNRGFIDAYKRASESAISRGYDAKYNGLEEKLKQMGLDRSSTGLGAKIALQREETDAYVNNTLKTYQLAHGLKQNTIDNMFKMGQQTVQEGSLELQRFANESRNEIAGRQQDLAIEGMKQDRAYKKSALELQQQEQRNPMRMALPFITGNNQLALQGINSTNQANHNVQSNSLQKSQLDMQQYQLEQMSQSDPFGQLLSTALGAGVGALTGGVGTAIGSSIGGAITGSSDNKWVNPDSSNPSSGTTGWNKNAKKLVGNKWS